MINRSRSTNGLISCWALVAPLYLTAHWASVPSGIQTATSVLLALLVVSLTLISGTFFIRWRMQEDKSHDLYFSRVTLGTLLLTSLACIVIPPPIRSDFTFQETQGVFVRSVTENGSCNVVVAHPDLTTSKYRIQAKFADRASAWPKGEVLHLKLHGHYIAAARSDTASLLSESEWLEENRKLGSQIAVVLVAASVLYAIIVRRPPRNRPG